MIQFVISTLCVDIRVPEKPLIHLSNKTVYVPSAQCALSFPPSPLHPEKDCVASSEMVLIDKNISIQFQQGRKEVEANQTLCPHYRLSGALRCNLLV